MQNSMFRTAFAAGVFVAASAGLATTAQAQTASTTASASLSPKESQAQMIAEGHYLAIAGDCAACHTDPGGAPYAGGVVLHTPFGNLVGSNLTPDKATGIGSWTDEQFVNAVKYGIGHDGERLFPGMPYVYFNNVSRADILKIRAYLATLPPVHNEIKSDQLHFPFNIRAGLIGWDLMYFANKGDYHPVPTQSAAWNRGAYLVQGLEHCALCHTDKNMAGADRTGQELQGYVVDGWNAPSLADDASGIGTWSVKDIATYLKTGHNAYADATGPMGEAIALSTSHLSDADLTDIGIYLKSVHGSGAPRPEPLPASMPVMQEGAKIYADECASCHTDAGVGLPGIFPALKASPIVQADDPLTIIRVVLHGAQSVATPAAPSASAMPAFGGVLEDGQVAAVLTYIRNGWGNAAPAVTAAEVAKQRAPEATD
jgi:mono/diheme cytochrome c family protein